MPNDDKNLKKAIASAKYIYEKLQPGVSSQQEIVNFLQAETIYLLSVIHKWQEDSSATGKDRVDWLEGYEEYDLTGQSPGQIAAFSVARQTFFQNWLDRLPSIFPHFTIIEFHLDPRASGKYAPRAYLSPSAQIITGSGGGPNSTVNPPPPPK